MRDLVLLISFSILSVYCTTAAPPSASLKCNAYFVRWPRVRLNFKPVATSRLSLRTCESACSLGEDPQMPGRALECAALNHHAAPDGFAHQCDVFQPHQLQNVDGYVEADDRYSFFWKYCLNSSRKCGGEYAFTYLSDRYMNWRDVIRITKKASLEDCLVECLEEKSIPCRSVSFNRTDGGCHISADSQLTKPQAIRLNNNPNFRIDYYENNCYNLTDTFKFEQECREDGIFVKVKSKFPYTGALYGLYDFFTCRIEPVQSTEFGLLFPSPTFSKNCSDSIRFQGDEMVLDVVLSTDGVEPLYFITPDDLTYQAKCPIVGKSNSKAADPVGREKQLKFTTEKPHTESSARTISVKTTSKAKLFKQTYPLPLITTQNTPSPSIKDATFKQVIQDIIRDHLDNANMTAEELSPVTSELLTAEEELFLAHFDPDNLPFLTKFQAPTFDFFTKLTSDNNALEHYNQTTLSTSNNETQSTPESAGELTTDHTLPSSFEVTTSESEVSDKIGISAQELTSLAPELEEEEGGQAEANAKNLKNVFFTTQISEFEVEGSGLNDVTKVYMTASSSTKKTHLEGDEKIKISDLNEKFTNLSYSSEPTAFKKNGESARFSTENPLNNGDEDIQLLMSSEEDDDLTNSTEYLNSTSLTFSNTTVTLLATKPVDSAPFEASTVLREVQTHTEIELAENTTKTSQGMTDSLSTEEEAVDLLLSSSGAAERREIQETTAYPKTTNGFENLEFSSTMSDESTQVPSSTEKMSMETVEIPLPIIFDPRKTSEEEADLLISEIQQVLAPFSSREGLSRKLNRESGEFSAKAEKATTTNLQERLQNKFLSGSTLSETLIVQQNTVTESPSNVKSELRVASDDLSSPFKQLHNVAKKEKSDGNAPVTNTLKMLPSKLNRDIQINEKKVKFNRKIGTESTPKLIRQRPHHSAMTQVVEKSIIMATNRRKTPNKASTHEIPNKASIHEGSKERRKIVDGSIKGLKSTKPAPIKASGTSKRKRKDRRSDFFLRRGSLIVPVKRLGPKIIAHRQAVQKTMTSQARTNRAQKPVALDNKLASTNALKSSEQREVLEGVKIVEAEQLFSHSNSTIVKPMLVVKDGVVQRLTAAGASKDLLKEFEPLLKNRRLSRRIIKLLQFLSGSVEKTKKEGRSESQDNLKPRTQVRQERPHNIMEISKAKRLAREKLTNSGQSKLSTKRKEQTGRKKSVPNSLRQLREVLAKHASLSQEKESNLTVKLTSEKKKSLLTHDRPVMKHYHMQKVPQATETLTTRDPSEREKSSMQTRPSKNSATRKALRAPSTVTPPNTHRIRRSTLVPTTSPTTTTVTTRPATVISTIPGATTTTAVKPTTTSTTSATNTVNITTTTKVPSTTKATTTTTKVVTQRSITTTPPSTISITTTRATFNRSPVIYTAGPPGSSSRPEEAKKPVKGAVSFDIFHNGQPVEAVVVGTKITLSFAPLYAIPPEYMSVRECQVEPIDSKYEWEKEPLPIIREGCQADLVGLVCPPKQSEFGVKVTVESFRYQSTPHVQYSCLVRICPFAPCPPDSCPSVDGCPRNKRSTRSLSLEEIRRALEADPKLASQIGISPHALANRPGPSVESHLLALGGDHTVKRRLVVVNSEDQLRYYVRTGDVS